MQQSRLQVMNMHRVFDYIVPEIIGFPIVLYVEKSKEKEVTDSEEDEEEMKEEGVEGDEPKIEEVDEEKEKGEKKNKTKKGQGGVA